MIWIVQLALFCTIIYFVTYHPQSLLLMLLEICKCVYYVFVKLRNIKVFVTTVYFKMKRYYLLKTRAYDDRPVMQPPKPIVKSFFVNKTK